jgi:hypothetical protein
MLELVVLILFLLAGYSAAFARTLFLGWRDKRQQQAAETAATTAKGSPITTLIHALGDPYEIEQGTTGRELYIWKFPPAQTLPKGTGLFILSVTTDRGVVTGFACKRQRQL